MKRFAAMIIASVMILSLFSACTGNNADPTTTAAETTATQETATQTQEQTTDDATTASPSDIPDAVPAELTDAPALNSFATNLFIKYVKPNIFNAPASLFSEEEKENARKALVLVIDAQTKAIELYDNNEAFYYLRGKAYEQSYYDTKDVSYKEKGLADLQKALDMGLAMAQTNYDALSQAE